MRIADWFRRLSMRDRRMLTFGAVAALLVLCLAVMLPLEHSVAAATGRIERKRADLDWMRGIAPELAAAGPVATSGGGRESLVVVIDQTAREAGLGQNLTSSEPSGDGGLRVRLERASFDSIMAWLARLAEHHNVRVETATFDAAGEPGLVTASVVLHGP